MRITRIVCDRCNLEHDGQQTGALQLSVMTSPGTETVYTAGEMCPPCTAAMLDLMMSFKGDRFTGRTTDRFYPLTR